MNTSLEVDLQIIHYPENCKEEWFQSALDSVKDEPVNLKIYRGNSLGSLHKRQEFFEFSTAPFVCWIDHDDELVPGTIQKCLDFLQARGNEKFCGVYTDYCIMNEESQIVSTMKRPPYEKSTHISNLNRPFHFILFRREAAEKSFLIPPKFHGAGGGDFYLILAYATLFGEFAHLGILGYKWRNRSDSQGKTIKEFPMLVGHCAQVITRSL